MRILIALLGCNVAKLLDGRVAAAVQFASQRNETVSWFLSGGLKNNEKDAANQLTEAEQMSNRLSQYNESWTYTLDTASTNTAENFVALSAEYEAYDDVFIVTSAFHQPRAALFAEKLIPNNRFQWILSPLELPDSRYWETVHIKNVDADVEKARRMSTLYFPDRRD
jgi:uncharacterized SAM-binding protein YcdF (DUF218 family)